MRWPAMFAALLLAGCLQETPAPASLDGPMDEADRQGRMGRAEPEGVRTFEASFDLVLNPDHELLLFTMVAGDRNCILFSQGEAPQYRLLGGTATMSWDAATPLADELVLRAFGATAASQASGPSPLTLDLSSLDLDPEGGGLDLMADHEVPQIPVRQAATLHVSFEYEGELPGPFPAFCTNGL
jgi:hypothetical protein